MNIEDDMYATIGRTVAACQIFEFLFTVCVKIVFKQSGAATIDEIAPLDHNSFRPATTALLNELKLIVPVHEGFEEKIKEFADRRHTLIHRWFVQKGWPSSQDTNKQVELIKFSLQLAMDATDLSKLLCSYVIAWMKRFPEAFPLAAKQEEEWEHLLSSVSRTIQIERA